MSYLRRAHNSLSTPISDEEVLTLARKWMQATPHERGSQMWWQSHISDYLGVRGDFKRVEAKIDELVAAGERFNNS